MGPSPVGNERREVRPLLKWVGGKKWLVYSLVGYYDRKRRLVDPFVGGMSIPLGFKPDDCLLSDINPHLINLYRWLQAGLASEPDRPVPLENTEKTYYRNRDRFNELCEQKEYWTREGALLFYYLNRSCFNGLCRFNQAGQFNTAYGKYKNLKYKTEFSEYKDAMANWEIHCGDFSALVLRPNDFIYADPPYDDAFTKFTSGGFSWSDQERLANWLAAHPGPVIASNSRTDRIIELYTRLGFKIYVGAAPRRVSCDGNRDSADEILAMKGF
jgi:DNA adenine methylase